MWVSKSSELIGSSPDGFEAAVGEIVARANRTLRGITGLEVIEKRIKLHGDGSLEYRVRVQLLFDVAVQADLHW